MRASLEDVPQSREAAASSGQGDVRPWLLAPRTVAVLALVLATAFAWNLAHNWMLSDDSFISFRYSRHLADGLGPVWNPGERVEGYTNFSWVVLIAAGMRLGLEPEWFSNAVGVACGLGVLVTLWRFTARGRSWRSPWPWIAAGAPCLSGSFAAWCTGGLETMFFTLLVFAGLVRVLTPWERPTRAALLCSALFGLAALTRPEGVLFSGLAFALLLLDVVRGQRRLGTALVWLVPVTLIVGSHLLWRHAYYGDWVPNTFRAKVGGLYLEQGLRYFAYYHDSYRIGWFVPLLGLACLGERATQARAIAFVLLVYAAYVLCIGGDWFELRFFVHVYPLLHWLLAEGLATLGTRGWIGRSEPLRLLAGTGAAALALTTFDGFERVPAAEYSIQSAPILKRYAARRAAEGQYLRAYIELGKLPRDLVMGLGGAGAVPYYTGWTCVDRRGLNDAYIARLPLDHRGRIAHEHDAPYDYLVERKVVVFDYFNHIVVKSPGVSQLKGPFRHQGKPLRMRAVPLGEYTMVFATFVSEFELSLTFPGLPIYEIEG